MCPCHNSMFKLDGAIIQPSPSPRSLDELSCEVRDSEGQKEVWVKYQDFYAGRSKRVVKA